MGEDHVYPMIAFGTLKKKSAFKIYAKAKKMDFALANMISEKIGDYDEAVKNAEDDDKDSISIYDFVDPKYEEYIEQSKEYWGIISDKKKAPSAYLLYQGNIRKEIGLIKCKSESTKKEYITCVIDGAIAENYKFLKNDILKVDSALLIEKVFNRIGIESFDVNTLLDKSKDDEDVWKLYENGYTIGVNQVEQVGSRNKCMKYKPKNISELSAFIAAIRPGFKSMYSKFEKREDFKWGIDVLDKLLRTEELPVSFLFFQEQVMSVLNYAGFPMDQCYGMIKAIAKKHPEKVRPMKEKFIVGMRERLINEEKLSYEKADEVAVSVWQIVSDNCGYGFNCISGETKILLDSPNGRFYPTVEEMYKIRNDRKYAKEMGHLKLHEFYNINGYGQSLSLCEDNKLRPNRIVHIKQNGLRQTYKVTTKSGGSLVCTDNHKFPTINGFVELSKLSVGDKLYCINKHTYKHHNIQENANGSSLIYDMVALNHRVNRDSCECCGRRYSENKKRFELHYKDFNKNNNSEDNFEWLCCSCHKQIHYKNGGAKKYENGITVYEDEIVSIEKYKVEIVYDVEMDDPYHTFVSESGLVTSNSAHAYCMALDSLYQAWQKTHYPYEFYEVLLQHYTDKGNKNKVTELKKEMLKGYGIKLGEYKFRNDNRKFVSDKEKQTIYPSLSSVKSIGQVVADCLYEMRNNQYDSFISLLYDLEETPIKKNNIEVLIKIEYFSEFGSVEKLLNALEWFKNLGDKRQIKKEKAELLGISREAILPFSGKETDKIYNKVDMKNFLKHYTNSLTIPDTDFIDLVAYRFEYLGYCDITNEDYKNTIYITDVNLAYSPKITYYSLRNGKTLVFKVGKNTFRKNPLQVGDFVKINKDGCHRKNKQRKLDNGKYQPIEDEFEWWFEDYKVIDNA